MKKRIGTKVYDTEKAICVLPDYGLYRQKTNQTYFLFDGETIKPLDFSEAKRILSENGIENITRRKPAKNGVVTIHISPEAADKLFSYCQEHGITQKKVIEDFIATLE